ncbi:hypothetical protein Q7P37_001191 [Cladosporium fusiforme]
MAAMDDPSLTKWPPADTLSIVLSFAVLSAIYFIGSTIYDVYFGPLSRFPGPKLNAVSVLPKLRTIFNGNDATDVPALHAKYGPIVRTSPNHLSFANGAAGYKEIYGFNKKGLYKDPVFYGKPFNEVPSIIVADDANHSRQRKILSHSFSDRALKEQEPLLQRWTLLMKDKMLESAEAGKKADLLKFYNCTTFDIMSDLTFAEPLNMLEDSEYSPWVKAIFNGIKGGTQIRGFKLASNLARYLIEGVLFKTRLVREKQLEHWNYSKERVDRRLARTPDRPDLWTKVIEKSSGPDGFSLGEHHSNAAVFMVAGTETTATALSGTTYQLLMNPDKLALLAAEIRSAFTSFDDFSLESLARQKYLMAVLQEGLRMYPPVPIDLPRVVPAGGATVCGEWVPEGTTVGVHHLATFRNEALFRKPYEFHPERWMGDPEFKDDHLDALEPFSVGPRNCLGKNLAWHEMRLLLATVMLHFDLKLCEESKDWNQQKIFTLWEKKPLMAVMTPVKV